MEKQIAEAIASELASGTEEESQGRILRLRQIINEIKQEMEKIRKTNIITSLKNARKGKAQRLLKYLDNVNKAQYDEEIMESNENCEIIIQSITRLYFLTEEFFALRNVINRPKFTMTAIDKSSKMYFRKDFEAELLNNGADYLRIERVASARGKSFGLRFTGDSVMAQMKKTIAENKQEAETAKQLYRHYQAFTEPYTSWGGKVNEGVMREAFEMHLENLHKSLGANGKFVECDMESEGRRWVMYRQASGSDPYFTGPDTALSQVKASNASLVSNIDTVLNTAEFIVQEGLRINTADLKAALRTKGSDEIHNFSSTIWKHLSESVQNEIIQAMGGSTAVTKTHHVIIK